MCSIIALAIAAPYDDHKSQPSSGHSTTSLDSNKPPLATLSNAKTPIANQAAINKPLNKREVPKTDQKITNTPTNNAQKNAAAAPSPIASDASKTPSNARPSRDTVKANANNTPQVASNQQKNAAPAVPSTPAKTSSNARPSRDTPKTPLTNAQNPVTPQKNAEPVPSTVQKTQSNSRNRRDTQTQQNSYKPQASGVPQKTNSPQSPVVSSPDTQKTSSNARPSRDTVKTPANNTPQVANNQQKNSAPAATAQKNSAPATSSNSRNRRDTPVKPTEVNSQKPVEWNKNEKKVNTQQPSTDNRKTRETPKTSTNTQVKDDKTKTPSTVQHPEVAKVPLTNARTRRDTPNPAEQSKLVPSGSISGKPSNAPPASQARDSPAKPSSTNTGNNRDTQKLNIRQPLPVDQVLKQKPVSANPTSEK